MIDITGTISWIIGTDLLPYVSAMIKRWCVYVYGGFLSHRGTPSHHPAIRLGFSLINQPAIGGTPMTMETPI